MALSRPQHPRTRPLSPSAQAFGEASCSCPPDKARTPEASCLPYPSRLSCAVPPTPWFPRDFGPINYTGVAEESNIEITSAEDELDCLLPTFCEQPMNGEIPDNLKGKVPAFPERQGDDFSSKQASFSEKNVLQIRQDQEHVNSESGNPSYAHWRFNGALDASETALDRCRRLRIEEWRQDQSQHHSTPTEPPAKYLGLSKISSTNQSDDDARVKKISSPRSVAADSDQDILNWILKCILHELLALGESMKSLVSDDSPSVGHTELGDVCRGLGWCEGGRSVCSMADEIGGAFDSAKLRERTSTFDAMFAYIVRKFRKRQQHARGIRPLKRPRDSHRTFLLRQAIIKYHHPLLTTLQTPARVGRACSEPGQSIDSLGVKRARTASTSSSVKRARTGGSSTRRAYRGRGATSCSDEGGLSLAWVEV